MQYRSATWDHEEIFSTFDIFAGYLNILRQHILKPIVYQEGLHVE